MGCRYDNGEGLSVRRDHSVEEERRVIDRARYIEQRRADFDRRILRIKQEIARFQETLLEIEKSQLLRVSRIPESILPNMDLEEPLDQAFFDCL